MLAIVNVLGTLTVGLCAFLLLRAYARVRQRLLLWSGLCFVGLTISNAILFVDLAMCRGQLVHVAAERRGDVHAAVAVRPDIRERLTCSKDFCSA